MLLHTQRTESGVDAWISRSFNLDSLKTNFLGILYATYTIVFIMTKLTRNDCIIVFIIFPKLFSLFFTCYSTPLALKQNICKFVIRRCKFCQLIDNVRNLVKRSTSYFNILGCIHQRWRNLEKSAAANFHQITF